MKWGLKVGISIYADSRPKKCFLIFKNFKSTKSSLFLRLAVAILCLACSIGSLHFGHILFMDCVMVNNRFWIVLPYDTTTSFLNRQGGFQGFINIFFGKFGQLRNIFPNVVSWRLKRSKFVNILRSFRSLENSCVFH